MTLSTYHQKFLNRSDEEMDRRARVKMVELRNVLTEVPITVTSDPVRIAVFGCADRRHVAVHVKMFGELLGKRVEVTTFDIAVEHLSGESGVVPHDVTEPLPGDLYDFTFSHVLLKFIETERQWDVLRNSYDALRSPELAIHVFDAEAVETMTSKQSDGYWSVPLERWKAKLME